MNVILCGMMGAGKTTIGIKVAEVTDLRWYDTDELIVDKHGKISDIFEYYGEEHFRRLETEVVKELSQEDGLVISSGGGLVLRTENSELLKKNGVVVFLRATVETLVGRLGLFNDRPLLQGKESVVGQKLTELMQERTPVYEGVSDYIVDVDGKTPSETADEIVKLLKEGACTH